MELKRKNLCPILKGECIQLDCAWFMKLYGTDPQDASKLIEEWGCAVTFQVQGLLEVAKRVGGGLDGVQKATESFRNVMVRLNGASLAEILAADVPTPSPALPADAPPAPRQISGATAS